MLPEALVQRGRATQVYSQMYLGYAKRKTSWVLRITPKGEFISLQKDERKLALPLMAGRSSSVQPQSGLDNYQYVLGTGAPGRDQAWASKYHEAYKRLLAVAPGPGPKAILAFIANPDRPLILPVGTSLTDAEAAEVLQFEAVPSKVAKERTAKIKKAKVLQKDPVVRGVYGCIQANAKAHHPNPEGAPILFVDDAVSAIFIIEVDGAPDWYQSQDFQAFHTSRLLTKNGDKRGTCSLCHQDAVLARLFPTGEFNPVTFNESAWSHFGAKQAYNAPTCVDCAYYFMLGLEDITGTKGSRTGAGDKAILWWSDRPDDPPLFPLLTIILDKDTTPKAREDALAAITDGHVAVFETLMGRTSVQRYYTTSADVVRANLQRWLETIGTRSVYATSHLLLSESGSKTKGANANAIQMLFLNIIANEGIPARAIRTVRDLMKKEPSSLDRRMKLTHYIKGAPMNSAEPTHHESYSPAEKAAFWFGMAFGKAETNQRGQSRPQRTIADRFYRTAKKSPTRCANICQDFSCQKVAAWMQKADFFLNEAGSPRIFNPRAQRAFNHGYNSYKIHRTALRNARTTETP